MYRGTERLGTYPGCTFVQCNKLGWETKYLMDMQKPSCKEDAHVKCRLWEDLPLGCRLEGGCLCLVLQREGPEPEVSRTFSAGPPIESLRRCPFSALVLGSAVPSLAVTGRSPPD